MHHSGHSRKATRSAGLVLGLLLLIYTLNFADRILVGILATPIKTDLHLSDTQLGVLGGTAFAILYSMLGIPVAFLADRVNRVRIIATAVVVWSLFTAFCGLANGFAMLLVSRILVGVGEAGGTAPSYSLLADYFPRARRARAFGIFSAGIPIGTAAGLVFGGTVAAQTDWRIAFFVMGGIGLIVAPIFLWLVAEPDRGRLDAVPPTGSGPSVGQIVRTLRGKSSFWFNAFGCACINLSVYGVNFWLPSFLVRSHGLSLLQSSLCYAVVALVGGLAGIWSGSYLADRHGIRSPRAYVVVPLVALIACIPVLATGVMVTSLPLSLACLLLFTALISAGFGPTITIVQQLVPPEMRSTASGITLFISNIVGLGLGSLVIGMLSDAFSARLGDDSLRYGILTMTVFQLLGAIFLAKTMGHVVQDWHQDTEPAL